MPASIKPRGQSYVLNGVMVEVVGRLDTRPAMIDPEAPENAWQTVWLSTGDPVLMNDGSSWIMYRPLTFLPDGRVQVDLRWDDGDGRSLAFIVPASAFLTPIWNCGQAYVPPPPPEPPVLDPDPTGPPEPSVAASIADTGR